jgi:hypothetical protein
MLYTYEKIGENKIWVSLNDLTGEAYRNMGLRIVDTGDDDPTIEWDERFKHFMEASLEESGEPWMIWSRPDLTYNKLWARAR